MDDKKQQLFVGLRMLLSGLTFENLLTRFRTNTSQINNTNEGIDTSSSLLDEYYYDSKLDVRIVYQDDCDGVFYPVNQTFDEYFTYFIEVEKFKILDSLKEISLNAASEFQLKSNFQYFLNEVEKLPKSYRTLIWEPLTEKTFKYIDETVLEIKEYIEDRLSDSEDQSIKRATIGKNRADKKPPQVLVSLLAKRDPKEISRLYTELTKDFIQDQEGQSKTFMTIFHDEKLPALNNRIKWQNTRALNYFIDKLESLTVTCPPKDKGKIAFTFPKNQWVWVKACFVKLNGNEHKYISNDNKELGKDPRKKLDKIIQSIIL